MSEVEAAGPDADGLDRLSSGQRGFLASVLGPVQVLADHSWPRQDTVVLAAESAAGRVIIKAAGGEITGHHLIREITALREMVPRAAGLPRLLAADLDLRILVTAYLPGRMVEGTRWEFDPGTYRQAGQLMSLVHRARPARIDPDYAGRMRTRTRERHAAARDLLEPEIWRAAGDLLAGSTAGPLQVVPTHGDMQPRNWLVEARTDSADPRVALIDFGRAEWRPWYSDLVRLHHQQFLDHPDLRDAFWAGAGRLPESLAEADRAGWLLENLLQSLGTIVWATQIGAIDFANAGRGMLRRTLAEA